jgi:hypothetical protein
MKRVAHPSGKTCSNLCGETIDLSSYGKSTSSNANGKRITNNHLNGNIQLFDVDDSSGDECLQFVGVKIIAAPTPIAVDEALAGKID